MIGQAYSVALAEALLVARARERSDAHRGLVLRRALERAEALIAACEADSALAVRALRARFRVLLLCGCGGARVAAGRCAAIGVRRRIVRVDRRGRRLRTAVATVLL